MRIPFLFLSVMVATVSAQAHANLCDSAWISTASGPAAEALIRAGADVNERCSTTNGNRPLHQAFLNDRAGVDLIRAPLEAGADPSVENIHGETPIYYAQGPLRMGDIPSSSRERRVSARGSTLRVVFGPLQLRGACDRGCPLPCYATSTVGEARRTKAP